MLGWCSRGIAPAEFRRARMRSSIGIVPLMHSPDASSAQPGPTAATTRPPIAAPAIWPLFIASLLIELASCSSSGGTTLGSSACWEGESIAVPVPVSDSRAIIAHSGGWVVSTRIPKPASPVMIARLAAMSTICGEIRSASTPPRRVNTKVGAICAAST